MKFGQLIDYNMRNIFLEESYTKCGKETISRPFLKNQNWPYLWINILRFYIFRFNCLPSWGLSKVIETADHLLLPHIKLFKKTKRGLELVSLPHFPHDFLRKIYLLLHPITWPNFNAWLPLLREILGNMCIVVVC